MSAPIVDSASLIVLYVVTYLAPFSVEFMTFLHVNQIAHLGSFLLCIRPFTLYFSFSLFFFFFPFEVGAHCVAYVDLRLMIFLPLPSQAWDLNAHEPPCLAFLQI